MPKQYAKKKQHLTSWQIQLIEQIVQQTDFLLNDIIKLQFMISNDHNLLLKVAKMLIFYNKGMQ